MKAPQPGPATRLKEVARTATTVTISWHPPTSAIKPWYQIRYRVKGTGKWTTFLTKTTKTTLVVTGLKPKTTYEFEVETTNGN